MSAYPLPKYAFLVKWNDTQIGFSEVAGLNMEIELIEYRIGDSPEHASVKFPGRPKYGNITMKRGTFANATEFYDWMGEIQLNEVTRRDITISLLDASGNPAVTWKAMGAFPVKIEATDFKSDGNEVAIESIEIAIEKLEIVQ